MKLSKLISRLQIYAADDKLDQIEVFIPVYNPNTFPGTPAVKVRDIGLGIDWDGGRLFLTPDRRLQIVEKKERVEE